MVGNNLGEGIADPCWGKTVIFFFFKDSQIWIEGDTRFSGYGIGQQKVG